MAVDEELAPLKGADASDVPKLDIQERIPQVLLSDDTVEVWKDVIGYEGYYQVSSFGSVKSLSRVVYYNQKAVLRKERILKKSIKWNNREAVILSVDKNRKDYTVHRLVALAFHPNPPENYEVNHIDGNPRNNHYSNLEWVTRSYNNHHSWITGLKNQDGEKNPSAKLKSDEVYKINKLISDGVSNVTISKIFNVSSTLISQIKTKKIWQHLGGTNG